MPESARSPRHGDDLRPVETIMNESFVKETRLPVPPEVAFAWHTRDGALERLIPPWQDVRILERHGSIRNDDRTVLGMKAGPFRVRWTAEHHGYEEGKRFCDSQREGPFSAWDHARTFLPDDGEGSILRDEITYRLPFGVPGRWLGGRAVRKQLEATFSYRHDVTRADLTLHAAYSGPPLTIAVTGSGGLIGSALAPLLTTGGHRVIRLVRRRAHSPTGEIGWDPGRGILDTSALRSIDGSKSADGSKSIDGIVHLAGLNIASGRWTRSRRHALRESRITATRNLVASLRDLDPRPRTLICASAIGIYGDRGDEKLDEDSSYGSGFLADLCKEWESAALAATELGIRVVTLRFGNVLSPRGGMLAKLLPPFRFGLGGPLGHGRQVVSWISIDDIVGAIHHCLTTEDISGAVNVTSPQPVTNNDFTRCLGRVLRRPAIFRVPALALKLLLGRMADETALAGSNVTPRRLLESGYSFRHEDLEQALRYLLGR